MGVHMGATMHSLLLCSIVLSSGWSVLSDNNVGCLFSPDVCDVDEECYDDNVFGRCQPPFDEDTFRHELNSDTVQLLENELSRLFGGGYRWNHEYAQCVIQNILYTNRHQLSYDPGLCSRLLQFTLPEVPPEIFSELQSPDPDELAFIKFKPNHDDPESDLYADEIFTPPIFSERAAKESDKLSDKRSASKWPKFESGKGESAPLTDTDVLMEELTKAAEDTQKLLEGFQDPADRYPDKNTPIRRTELSSDLNHLPAFTEGGTQWLPLEEDDRGSSENEIIEPYDKKRVKIVKHFNNEIEDNSIIPKNRNNEVIKLGKPEKQTLLSFDEEELPTFGRSPAPYDEDSNFQLNGKHGSKTLDDEDSNFQWNSRHGSKALDDEDSNFQWNSKHGSKALDDEDSNFQWNSKHRSKALDDDLTRFAHGNRPRVTQREKPEPIAENMNLNDVIENDYLEDQLYAILPTDKGFPTFTSDKRYDIKKPGPTYMIHEDEDGDTSNDESEMAMRGTDKFLQSLSKNSWQNPNQFRSLFEPPVGILKPLSPFTHVFEATDEISRIYVTGESGELGDSEKKGNEKNQNAESKSKPFERLSADQPEVIEGVDIDPSKPIREEDTTALASKTGEGHIGRYDSVDATTTNLVIKEKTPTEENAYKLVKTLEKYLDLDRGSFSNVKVKGQEVTFKVNPNTKGFNASEVAEKAEELSSQLKEKTGLTVEEAGIGEKVKYEAVKPNHDRRLIILTFALCGAVAGILLAAITAYLVKRHAQSRDKLHNIAQPDTEAASQDYQDLCRQRMAAKANEKPEPAHTSTHSPKKIRSLSQEGQASTSSHSSTSSWNEEPVTSNMDISTGHMILSYMEDHLKNKNRLDREWEALCAYEAELCSTLAATQPPNVKKNRYTDVLPYDHSRVVLNELSNVSGSDYINSSSITDHDPRNPAYIATQGPLPQTAADFWQMIWEQGSVVIVMLSRLMENGVAMCHRYWPEEGSEVYHIYEVHLVSEHIWCDDYLVRSFYLKNLRTSETRTVTQFHFMSWPDNGVPNSTKALLEFRRKVNKSYRGRSCPIVVHCSDGIGRTGTYCLIDMVLNRMAKGTKEIDIAATLEHVRDQRAGMVKTKAQFEFVLMAIAEEVHAILKALSQ